MILNGVLQLVLGAMQSHRSSLHVQLISSACVFDLTSRDLAEALPLSLLSAAVARLLDAMKTFPNHQQVSPPALPLPPDAAAAAPPFVVAPILPPTGTLHTLNPQASLFFHLLSLQVQMNCLLALCSEYILQEVPFDK